MITQKASFLSMELDKKYNQIVQNVYLQAHAHLLVQRFALMLQN